MYVYKRVRQRPVQDPPVEDGSRSNRKREGGLSGARHLFCCSSSLRVLGWVRLGFFGGWWCCFCLEKARGRRRSSRVARGLVVVVGVVALPWPGVITEKKCSVCKLLAAEMIDTIRNRARKLPIKYNN